MKKWKKQKMRSAKANHSSPAASRQSETEAIEPELSIDEIIAGAEKKTRERAEKAAAHASKPLPDLTPRACLVAFIDILGFGREIESAKTKQDLENAYRKVRLVQEEFQMESAVAEPEEQAEINRNFGRRVIALSDAVVVVVSPNCWAGEEMGGYDHLGFAVYELILAQALCAVRHGIFIRGGLSHGAFFFENDVLLSPALARAYELESTYAGYPVIAVAEGTKKAILGAKKKSTYAPGADPTEPYFAIKNVLKLH